MGAVQRLVQRAQEVGAAHAPDVPSPCVSVCRMDPRTQLCEGCFRTLDEIAGWSAMADGARREVWRMIAERARTVALTPGLRQEETQERP